MKKILTLCTFLPGLLWATSSMTPEQVKKEFLGQTRGEEATRSVPKIKKEDMPTLDQIIPKEKQNIIDNQKKERRLLIQDDIKLNFQQEAEVQKRVDFSYRDTPAKDQSNFTGTTTFGYKVGTCTAYGLASAMENMVNNKDIANLSERHIWDFYREADMTSAIEGIYNAYITEESYWKETTSKLLSNYKEHAHTRITGYTDLGYDTKKAILALDQGKIVYIGMSTPTDMYNCKAVVKSNSNTGGGHALAVVGYQLDTDINGSGYFIIKNSWGPDCGDNGHFYVPFSFCDASGNYCYMYSIDSIETAWPSVGTTPTPTPIPDPTPVITPTPVTFDPAKTVLGFEVYKKWYSSTYTIYLYLDSSEEDINKIKSVTYTLHDSSIAPAKITDSQNNFEWSFGSKRKSYTITYDIILKTGEIYQKVETIEY